METALNDRWSRAAARMTEPERQDRAQSPARSTAMAGSPCQTGQDRGPVSDDVPLAMKIAGLTPEDVRKLTAKFKPQAVKAEDKNGTPATALANVVSLWIQVTPEMAARWMKSNFRNRPVSDDTVAAYARDMAAGRWQATHQGIGFNDRDQLIDGQHRLLAVIKSKRTVRMMVTFGLPSEISGSEMTTMDCVDRGRTRSVADQLKIQHGLKAGSQIAQLAGVLAHLCVGERIRRLSVGQTLDIYRAFQTSMDCVIANRSKAPGLKSAGVLGAFAFAIAAAGDGKAIVKLFLALNTGNGLQAGRPIQRLREFLTGEQSSLVISSLNRGVAELVLWAILAELASQDSGPLSMRPEEWQNAVHYFREQQPERVKQVAKLFLCN